MDKKLKIAAICMIAPFVLTLIGIAFKSISLAVLVAIFAILAVYGVGVLFGKFSIPGLSTIIKTEDKK